MKNNAKKRVLALLLTLAMLLPNLTGLVPAAQAAEVTTGTANVYDIYDLTGSQTNTIKGTDETWDGQIHAYVSAEHKENIVFKTKLTMGEQEVRLSLNALDGASIYDPSGYAVFINHNGGAPYIAIKRNMQDLVLGSVAAVAGTWELEIGLVDILTDGVRTGKHLYVKKDGAVVCEVDDTNGYLTGDALGTKIIDFHYGAAIQMDTTYTNEYGTANVYDIYDLTGSQTNTIKGTDESWDGQIRADVSAEHKENFSFKTKLTMGTQNVRLSLTAKDGDSHYDPVGYAVYLYGADNVVEVRRNNTGLKSASVASLAGTYTFEVGIVDILFGGQRIGKHLYVKMDDVVVCEYDDMDGYLTGDALGTKIIDFHYGAAIQMDTTYESSYGTVNVYDIADLTGSETNNVASWTAVKLGSFAEDHKENAALKAVFTTSGIKENWNNIRLSLGAQESDDVTDPKGYGLVTGVTEAGVSYIEFKRNNQWVAGWNLSESTTPSSVLMDKVTLEFGYRSILLGETIVGKQLYLAVNGVETYTYDDTEGFLTGDALGTKVGVFHYHDSLQLNTANVTTYGEVNTYDIADLTGSEENYYYGTGGSAVGGHDEWSGTTIGNVSGDKENIGFKATVTKTAGNEARFSMGALDTANAVDFAGYALRISDDYVDIFRNNTNLQTFTGVDMTGTYVLEFSIQSILLNGEVTGKRLTVKKDGAVIGTYDDLSGCLTGDTLGTKIAVFTYGNGIQMNTTYTNGYGEVTVYDIYDLDGSTSKTLAGTDGGATWSNGQLVGNFPTDSKENVAFKTKVTVSTTGKQYRFSFGALDNTKCLDPMGYGFTLNLTDNVLRFVRNNADLGDNVSIDPADYIGTWELEFGYRDIIEKNVVVGKQVYMLKDGVEIYRYDDKSGYLTGDSLGTIISVFHYANSITMESLYETSYADVTVYDIYDLTGAATNTVNGAVNGDWAGVALGNVAADKKENVALKTNLTVSDLTLQASTNDLVRLSLSSSTSNHLDCSGYSMRIYTDNNGNWYFGINKNGNGDAKAKSAAMTADEILSTHELEFGYRDIIFQGNVIGKQVYLKKGGVVIVSYDDTSDYLTGSSLTTTISAWGYCTKFQVDTTYAVTVGEMVTYDVYDLTRKVSNVFYGTSGSSVGGHDKWSGTTIGNVASAKKENVNFKAQVTVPAGVEIRFSLGALESANAVDYAGYALYIKDSALGVYRNNGNLASFSVDMTGTYVLEFGIQDVMVNGQVVSKRLTVKKDGVVVGSCDDASGYLTGDTLGTKIAVFHYGSSIQMNSTLEPSIVAGYNLTLGGLTAMNLYLDTGVIDDPAATVTIKIEGEKASQTYALQDLPMGANGLPMVTAKLASGQMNDAVTVTVTKSNGETEEKTYSVAGYVDFILEQNYSDELKRLAKDMLHYGAAAQVYFNYNTENPANANIKNDNVNETVTATAEKTVEGSVDGVSIYGASLILRDDTTLRYYLNITGDVNDYTFSINGEKAAPRKVSGTGVNYCVQYDGILPNRLGDVYTLIISKGSDTMAVNYSPTIYMKNIYAKGGNSQLLAQELYDYYYSAKAYAGSKQIDTPVVLDLYQITGKESVTVPGNQPFHLGMLMDTDDGLVKTELTSNVAIRFKYTGGEGMRIQIGATTPDLSVVSGGALFMSVPDNNSFGIANILDNGTWCQDKFSWQECLGRDQSSYIELGCVKVYTDGEYTQDRYYVRAAASLEELDAMAQNGTFSVYYDTAMKSNNGNRVIIRSRLENGGDVLATTWTDEAVTAYENSLKSAAQNATSGDYDKLAEKYPDAVDTSNTAESLAAAKKPTGSTTATGGDELILWAESGASKIVQDDDGKAATQAAQKNTLSIQMAKNESEGAQLMLFGKRNVESYEIFVTDLTSGSNVITADNIRLYQLKYLTVDGKRSDDTTYDTPSQYRGEKLPDAMLPFAKAVEYDENVILAGNNQAIYVDVTADRNVVAGTYNGTIVVKTNTDQVYTLDISVVVRDVVMPDTSKLGSYAPYLNRDAFSSGELDGSDEMAALYVQTLESFNMSSIAPTSDGVMNLEKFLVNVRRNYDSMTNYLLPVDSNESYYNGEPVYCNYALLREYVVELAKMSIADGKNYLDKAFFYPSDHVDEAMTADEFALAQETYTVFRQVLTDADAELTAIYAGSSKYTAQIASSVKNLRFLLTVPSDDSVGKSLAIGDLLDEYFPKTNADNKNVVLCTTNDTLVRPKYYGDSIKEAVGDDRELWTYLCLKPFYPHSNYAFDTPVVGLRTLGWTCYQEGIDTLMTWKSVSYLYDDSGLSLDRWTTSIFGEDYFTPGDGNMFYPGAKYGIDGACPSLRAMAWRDGVDDYNLMSAVVENGGSAASLNSLYSLITKAGYDYVKLSGSGLGSLITRQIEATHPIDDDAKFIIVRNALLQMAASNASEHATIVANAQTAVNGVTAATGTTNALESPASESTATITGNIYTDGYYQLADFETYEETIQNKFMGNAQLALSDLAQHGSYSLKVAVQPGQDGETVWIPTTSKYFSATTNFSSASKITFKVYNAQNAGSTVRFYLNTYNRANDEYGVYSAGTYNKADADIWHDDHPQNAALRFSLEHGWNEITIDMADIGVDLTYVGAFVIAFDSGVGCDAQQVYYLDDVRVYMTKVS